MISRQDKTQQSLFVTFTLLLSGSLYFHANIGGSGFRIPNNIVIWFFACLIGFYGLYLVSKSKTLLFPRYSLLLLAFPVLALFSGIFSGVNSPTEWFLRLFYIWGGLLFLFALFQFKLKQGQIDHMLLMVVLAGVLHALVGCAQVFITMDLPAWIPINPAGMPTGTFQQINNQASFQTTTLLISLWLLTRPLVRRGSLKLSFFLLLAISLSVFVISFSGSRVAFLGLVLAAPLLLISRRSFIKQDKKIWLMILLAINLTIFGSSTIENKRGLDHVADKLTAANAGYSGEARLGIYSITLDLIRDEPIFGHGIGSFVKVWQLAKPEFFEKHPDAELPKQRVSHPHNELIFWLVEGGIAAGIGLALALLATILALIQLPASRRYAYAALLIPIAIHTQVELPFYISSLHWFVFLFLLFICFQPLRKTYTNPLSYAAKKLIKVLSLVGVICSSLFMGHSMAANLEFRSYILKKADPKEPFVVAMENPYFKNLASHSTMTLLFEQSQQLGVSENISLYADWIEGEIERNPNINYFKLAIRARLALKDEKKACEINETAQAIYPSDKNFNRIKVECDNARF